MLEHAEVKLLGTPIWSHEFVAEFVKKKLKALADLCKTRREERRTSGVWLASWVLVYKEIDHLRRS